MIVRIMGEGQWQTPGRLVQRLNVLDDLVMGAVNTRDSDLLAELLEEMADTVKKAGTKLPSEPVVLSAREWAVLEPLLARPGMVLSRSQLEEKLYGWKDGISSNAVEVYIHGLRKKLGADVIRNVRGVGYMVPRA